MPRRNARPSGKDRHAKTRLAYAYLQRLAAENTPYTRENMMRETGWKAKTVDTHRRKRWSDWVKQDSRKIWRVSPSFTTINEAKFIDLHKQATPFYAIYDRFFYHATVTYEFLLPLTKEQELKEALDALFYRDSVERRLNEVGLDSFPTESPDMDMIIGFVNKHFTGYSISHVSGRFRTQDMTGRKEAGKMLTENQRYLVDETTAVVRFIVPLHRSQDTRDGDFLSAVVSRSSASSLAEAVHGELEQVRWAFFQIFAEAVVRTVKGEDEVWLLESGPENRLYVWEKA